jgi:protein-disulfide isomerase
VTEAFESVAQAHVRWLSRSLALKERRMNVIGKLAVTTGLLFLPVLYGATAEEELSGKDTVLVEINGTKLTVADLERQRPGSLFQARNSYYEATQKAVQDYIEDYLLRNQAEKEGVTLEQLLERHVTSTLPPDPPEEALKVYYEGVDTTQPYEAVRNQILESIRQRRLARAKNAYVESLRSKAEISILLKPPRAEIAYRDAPVRGSENAPVTIIEYADYECPYCQETQPALDKLEAEYKGKLAFVFKDTPLPMHSHAEKAAEAAHCAGAQGKYWEYHDLLFKERQLEVPQLKEAARELKLDGQAFDQCLDSNSQADLVRTQLNEASRLGLQGTPSFFINGRFFSGAMSYDKLREIVEQELGGRSHPPEQRAAR